jgi:hypothetical protein
MHMLPSFAHRRNFDGNYDSICTRCYATAASAGNEETLSSSEAAHVCEPRGVYLADHDSVLR